MTFTDIVWIIICCLIGGAAVGAFAAIVSGQFYAIPGMATTAAAYATAIQAVIIIWEIMSELGSSE